MMLSVELEAALVRELRRTYEKLNQRRFAGGLKPAVLVLVDTERRVGQWLRNTRRLELSRKLVLEKPWLEVVGVLEHEMAHQFVDEVLAVLHEPPHGPTFQRVCAERGIDAKATGELVASESVDTEDARALDRIRKLLALAGSDNQNEAEIAMRRAHELMLRHNVDKANAQGDVPRAFEVRQIGKPQRRANGVEIDIVGLLTEFFFVEVIRVPVYVPQEATWGDVYELIGTSSNIEMAAHVFAFLSATAERLWQENRGDRRVKSGRDKRAYQSGVVRGFREKLIAERNQLAGTGLVWVGDGNLDAFFRARYPRIMKRRRTIRLGGAHAAGREAGRKVVLHKPVSSTSGTSGGPRLLR